MSGHRLLISCRDEVGLVHRITGVLFRGGFNIVGNDEFVDQGAKHFFMRTAFAGPTSTEGLVNALREVLPPDATVWLAPPTRRTIVLLATKEAHCLGDLLLGHEVG